MRGTTGAAHHGEPFEPEVVGDGPYVLNGIGDTAARQPVGLAVARPVVGDELGLALVQDHAARSRTEPAAGHPVQQEDRSAARIPRRSTTRCRPSTARTRLRTWRLLGMVRAPRARLFPPDSMMTHQSSYRVWELETHWRAADAAGGVGPSCCGRSRVRRRRCGPGFGEGIEGALFRSCRTATGSSASIEAMRTSPSSRSEGVRRLGSVLRRPPSPVPRRRCPRRGSTSMPCCCTR